MKEIKFRGKRKDNSKWVYGGFMQTPEATFIIDYSVVVQKAKDGYPPVFDVVEVFPETVGQYTGLCDKNGREIYAGDIVEAFCENYEVKFIQTETGLYVDYGYPDKHNGPAPHWIEIIGSIYENPELLEQGK